MSAEPTLTDMMTAQPFEVPVPAQLVNFRAPRRSFVLLNSRPKPTEVRFAGNLMTIPPVHTVGPHSDVDLDGDPIPGTYVIEDSYVPVPEISDEVLVLDAVRCVCHILGLQPGPDGTAVVASGPYALAGLSLIPRHCPKELWKQTAAAGEKRAFFAEVEHARVYVKEIDDANEKRKAAGFGAISDKQYTRSIFLIQEYEKLTKRDTMEMLAPHQKDKEVEEIELTAIARVMADEIATRIAAESQIDKMTLLKKLLEDPKVRKLAEKEYQIRKRGRNPVTEVVLEEAIARGVGVTEAEQQLREERDAEPVSARAASPRPTTGRLRKHTG